jgi:hypothetical protein
MAIHRIFDPKFFGPLEAVDSADLCVGNEVWGSDDFPWLKVVSIADVQKSSPEWERAAGKRLIHFESVDDYGRVRHVLHYDNCDSVVVRRRKIA